MHSLAYGYLSTPTHSRSISLGPPRSGLPPSISKAKSTTDLNMMAAANRAAENGSTEPVQDSSFRTINDPRTTSASDLSRSGSTSSKHPDLSNEVSTLSDKLVSAIEHNSSLDEKISETKGELEALRKRTEQLEQEARTHKEQISSGELLTREQADELNNGLNTELADERRQKQLAQQEKRGIETELETLTASLFEEANKMVAAANMQRDAVEKKNQQLRDQIKDGEAVVASQTEQLAELKNLMQTINTDYRKELESPRVSMAPSSPGIARGESDLAKLLEAMNLSPVSAETPVLPSPSTNFKELLRPQCRTDIPSYDDFQNLVQSSSWARSHNPSHAPSRAGSGSYSGLAVLGMSSLSGNTSSPNLTQQQQQQQQPGSKLANSPQIPGSFSPNPNPDLKGPALLKDTRFFKRIMAEDVEPTLRLDLSPSISWLNRRSIISALSDSSLIVEPIPEVSMRLYGKYTSCQVCGDSRRAGENPRTHAMRIREGEGATKWSICLLCLEKVRAVGDLIAYVRNVREGVVKCGDRNEEEEAWEQIIRMRERLFWARMAGGVVPAFLPSNKNSPITGAAPTKSDDDRGNDGDLGEGQTPEPDSRSGFHTPGDGSRPNSQDADRDTSEERDEETKSEKAAQLQLQQALDASLTTFESIKEKRSSVNTKPVTTPPATPPRPSTRARESGSGYNVPKLSMPKVPDGFWTSKVNTLH